MRDDLIENNIQNDLKDRAYGEH